jgi:splicing factor, arginine/serine-rich 12
MAGGSSTKVVQITNIAPQATKDQMQALLGNLGKIDEIRLCEYIWGGFLG